MVAGVRNTETSVTELTNTSGQGDGLLMTGGTFGTAIHGVGGAGSDSIGVVATAGGLGHGIGVIGTSTFDAGVLGSRNPAVLGIGGKTGVRGVGGTIVGSVGVEGIGTGFEGPGVRGIANAPGNHASGV